MFARRSIIGAALVASVAVTLMSADTTTRHAVSLTTPAGTVSAVVLTNTHARDYTDSGRPAPAPNRCTLAPKDAGVLWKIVVEGAEVDAKAISVVDDTGNAFQHVCWSSSGTVFSIDKNGRRTGGGPQTEFLAAGTESPKRLTIKIGAASAVIPSSQ
jgi:hypothetical protein